MLSRCNNLFHNHHTHECLLDCADADGDGDVSVAAAAAVLHQLTNLMPAVSMFRGRGRRGGPPAADGEVEGGGAPAQIDGQAGEGNAEGGGSGVPRDRRAGGGRGRRSGRGRRPAGEAGMVVA